MWVALMVGGPVFIVSLFTKETLKDRILRTENEKNQNVAVPTLARPTVKQVLIIATTRPMHMLCTEPLVFFLSIYTAFGFAMLFSFFGSYPFVFTVVYHFDQKSVGLAFLGILVGFLFAIVTFAIFDKTLYRRALVAGRGKVAPEHRLYAAMLGSIILPVSLFW
jgi:hypothetical protein